MSKILLLTGLLASNTGLAGNFSKVDRQWKARALQGLDELEKLQKDKGSKTSTELACKMQLEYSYAALLDPKLKDITSKENGKTKLFRLVFNENGLTIINFFYVPEKPEPVSASIVSLAKDWEVLFGDPIKGMLVVQNKNCQFLFDLKNPLDGTVAGD